jgi:DNA polymerase-3 subunit gamma/tau
LDQLASFGGPIKLEQAEELLGKRAEDSFFEIFDAIAAGDVGAVFRSIQSFVAQGRDLRQLAFDALEHTRSLLLLKSAPEAEGLLAVPPEDRPRLLSQAESLTGAALLRTLDLLGKAIIEMRNAPNHRLLLEVALVRAAAPDTDPSPNGLLGRIERLERRIGISGPAPSPATPAATPASVASGADAPVSPVPKQSSSEAAPASAGEPGVETSTSGPARRAPELSDQPAAGTPPPAKEPAAKPAKTEVPVTQPEAPSAPLVEGAVGFGHVRDAWPATLKETNKASKRIGAFLHSSRPVSMEGEMLVVEVQSDFHAQAMTEQRNKEVLADALHAALGVRPQLRFVQRGQDADPSATSSGEGGGDGSGAPGESIADLEDAEPIEGGEHDPFELVKKGLGAEVVEERGAG